MSTKNTPIIKIIIPLTTSLISALGVYYAFFNAESELGHFLAFFSATLIGLSLIVVFIYIKTRKAPNTSTSNRFVYVSFPFNLDSQLLSKIKDAFQGLPFLYTDDIIKPGDKFQDIIDANLQHVAISFVIVCGEMTYAQKYEVKVLKHVGAKIIPVIVGDGTIIPTSLREYQAITLDDLLAMSGKGHEKIKIVVNRHQ